MEIWPFYGLWHPEGYLGGAPRLPSDNFRINVSHSPGSRRAKVDCFTIWVGTLGDDLVSIPPVSNLLLKHYCINVNKNDKIMIGNNTYWFNRCRFKETKNQKGHNFRIIQKVRWCKRNQKLKKKNGKFNHKLKYLFLFSFDVHHECFAIILWVDLLNGTTSSLLMVKKMSYNWFLSFFPLNILHITCLITNNNDREKNLKIKLMETTNFTIKKQRIFSVLLSNFSCHIFYV